MHVNLLCECSHSEAMKGWSSLTSCNLLILSHLSSSPDWAQLTLFVPAWGTRSLSLQNGAPIHRVRAHSLTGIRNRYISRRCMKYLKSGKCLFVAFQRILCKLGNGTNRKRGITSTVFKSISKNSEALVLRG
jgi:hypothetical protein